MSHKLRLALASAALAALLAAVLLLWSVGRLAG